MISTWSEWKRYPRAGRGGNIEAPITPGLLKSAMPAPARCTLLRRSITSPRRWPSCRSVPNHGLDAVSPRHCPISNTGPVRPPPGPMPRPPRNLYERRGLSDAVIPGWSEGPDLRGAITPRGISRFPDAQLRICGSHLRRAPEMTAPAHEFTCTKSRSSG